MSLHEPRFESGCSTDLPSPLLQDPPHRPRLHPREERAGGGAAQTLLTHALFCPQIMSVLLFIEHSVEVAHGKAACKFSRTGYLRIGRSRGHAGEQEGEGTGPWLGGGLAGFEALPLPLLEPLILHQQMGPPGVGADRMALCKPKELRKATAGLPCLRRQRLPVTLEENRECRPC